MASKYEGHTPGPWVTYDEETGEHRDGELAVAASHEDKGGDGPQIAFCNPLSNYPECQANARLIAAAPTLLGQRDRAVALLRAVLCSEFSGEWCDDVDGRNWFDVRAALLAELEATKGKP